MWKSKLRAWLIDLVREAIRLEKSPEQPQFIRATPRPVASKPMTTEPEPSFESMQAKALRELEEYEQKLQAANGLHSR